MKKTVAIIGAGPAGATLARELSSNDFNVLLYDHRAPWDKPCGGMLRAHFIDENPELQRYPYPIRYCREITYASPGSIRKKIPATAAVPVISRLDLGRFVLDQAVASGANFIPVKVRALQRKNSGWTILADHHRQVADVIIGADGANSIVRKYTVGRFKKDRLALTCGYLLDGIPAGEYLMSFTDIEGFVWVFSRPDFTSAGIGSKLGALSAKILFDKLDQFLDENYSQHEVRKKFSALIPMAENQSCFEERCCGENWILVGDAAGHVDPIIGEGLYFAFASAKSAARAILSGDIPSYDKIWRKKYGRVLDQRARLRQTLSTLAASFSITSVGEIVFSFLTEEETSSTI
jgi:flavin-dependent dehydrogenase